MAAPRRSSIERQLDEAVERWADAGLIERTEWRGRPLLSTPLPRKGVYFDEAAVERVLRFFLLLRQLIGRWAGREFRLLDWQVRWLVAPVFGIKWKATGFRVFRTVWFEIPRKNGKSTLCSGLALYLLTADREMGAQVFAAAGDRTQAGLVFRPARQMALGSPDLAKALGKGIRTHYLEHPRTGSVFRALSSDGARQHGLNVHGAVIDEVHVHKNPDVIDALETGTGSRDQPLVIFITTADDGVDGSIYATKREYLEGVAAGHIDDATFYGVVFGVDHEAEGFDPFSDDTLAAANPGAGVTVMWDYLRGKANEARQSPSQLNRYLRLHLNVRTKQTVRWLPLDAYDVTRQLVDDNEWRGNWGWAGLDLSSTTDLTAYVFRGAGDPERGHPVRMLCWVPEERVRELERKMKVPLQRWIDEGWVRTTEGNVVDYAAVRADIRADVDRYGYVPRSIAYDPWNATETVQLLEAEGFEMVPVRQGYATLSPPAKSIERQIIGSTPARPMVRTGSNPVLRWMVDCVQVKTDTEGNIRPVKQDRSKSTKRIDGVVAWIMAEREAMAVAEESSAAGSALDALRAEAAASA